MAEDLVLKGKVSAHTTDMVTPVHNSDMIVTSSLDKLIPFETTMKISDLPVNMVEEILSRVPLRYMRDVRLTCKEWDSSSKSRNFSKMHIGKLREGGSLIIAMMDHNIYLIRVVLGIDEDPSIECQGKFNKQIKISQVIHCGGLLLCVLEDDATKVIVWNPYWGQTRSIEFRDSYRPDGWDKFNYALGYEDKGSCRSYKFLRFIDKYYNAPIDQFSWYEIYDFDSSSWKTLDITPHYWRILYFQHGVSLKGNTYWPASQRNIEDHIICFDFSSESFGPLLRLPFDVVYGDYVSLSCVREEKLVVLLTHVIACPIEFEIWISTKIEAEEVLWSKFLTLDKEMELDPLIKPDNFFIDEEQVLDAMGYSKTFNIVGEDGYLKKLERAHRDRNIRVKVCSYVPSLVQPAPGGKMKHQSMLSLAAIGKA